MKYSEVIFIAVGTPQGKDHKADLSYVKQAAKDIGCSVVWGNQALTQACTVMRCGVCYDPGADEAVALINGDV